MIFIFTLNFLVFYVHGTVQSREKILSDIALEITGQSNATMFDVEDVKKIFKTVGFKNCSTENVSKNCQLCLGVSDLLQWNGHQMSDKWNRTQLRKFFPRILYLLTPIPSQISAVCNSSISTRAKNLTTQNTAFRALLSKYGGSNKLAESQIEHLLEDINNTISTRLTTKPCFDVDEALKGSSVAESGADANDLEHLSGFIILQLIKGHCISKHEHAKSKSNLPAPKAFMDALFKEFAHNGTMSLSKFESLLTKLGIGKANATATTTSQKGHEGHNHRKKRSIDSDEDTREGRQRRSVSTPTISGKCYSPENLFTIHSLSKKTGINQDQFKNICPSLIQQIESGACKSNANAPTKKSKEQGWKPWVSSVVAVLIISFGSLIGILVAPFSHQKSFTLVLTFLIALAVSTLLGDALLHLLPHALDLHKHDANTPHTPPTSSNSFIWKSLVFIVGIYCFYIFESIMHSMQKHGHSHDLQETHQHIGKGRSHSMVSGPVEMIQERNRDADHAEGKHDCLITTVSGLHKCDDTNCIKMEEMQSKNVENSEVYVNLKNTVDSNTNSSIVAKNGHAKDLKHQDKLAHNGHSHNGYAVDIPGKKPELKTVAWMVLFGDAIHNFMDGIAIGVAFTDKFPTGFYGGISTSIAILCHEMPHELGDFAILIQSGLSIKVALMLNFLSSLTAIVGCLIGVSLGQSMNASAWIFAATAGLFVYIALVDMLPELIHNGELRHSPCKTMLIQNTGLLLGFGMMLCLALFEEKIRV